MAGGQATKSLHETVPPKSAGEQQKKVPPTKNVSFCDCDLQLAITLQRFHDFRSMNGKIDTVDVARSRQVHSKLFSNTAGTRRKNYHAIAETSCLADVVRNKHDCFVPRFPDSLKVSIELLTSQRIESSKRLIHQQHARIRRQRAGKRDALLHSARQLVNVGALEPGETDKLEVVLGHLV